MGEALPILFEGSRGGWGGPQLRAALALSCVTGRPFGVAGFRARQPSPGLRPDHVELLRAAARLCDAALTGDAAGSQPLSFAPRRAVAPGDWRFELAGAGSAPLLFQAICWPLSLAGGPSTLTLAGGTHLQGEPSFHELALAWGPAMARLGFRFEFGLEAAGFEPGGGGAFTVRIEPARAMPPLDLRHRGLLREVEVLSMVGDLPFADAVAEADRARKALTAAGVASDAERLVLPVRGSRGRHTLVVATFERVRCGHGATRGGARAGEGAAGEAVASFQEHLARGGAVDRHLADQLLLPAALVAAGRVEPPPGVVPFTRYTASARTPQLERSAEVVRRFLDVEISVLGAPGEEVEIRVQPPGARVELLPLHGS
jgi:RNA 3'-terminal phosphate cyclase (ATP)